MEIKTVTLGDIGTNCYLISGETGAVVIDPGFSSPDVTNFLSDNKDKQRLIILTHSHFDHIGGALELKRATDTDIAIGELDNAGLSETLLNLSSAFGENTEPFSADILLKDGQELNVGDLKFSVICTPGHTAGGISLKTENALFCGDTLFYESVGRTDFPGGSAATLKSSILRLYKLDGHTVVYPGHGPATTIAHEKTCNPYVREL